MRLSKFVVPLLIFIGAATFCIQAAVLAVDLIEENSRLDVLRALEKQGLDWAEADTNGLQVFVIGTAPTEADRFKALSTTRTVVDAARVIDQIEVQESDDIKPPRFSIEILRNDAGLSLIGLIPTDTDRAALVERMARLTREERISDLLETADFPAPDGWQDALDFSTIALQLLPRSKISVESGKVRLVAMTESPEARIKLEEELRRKAPPNLEIDLELTSPRPVITPFTLRFIIDENGARFDACSADDAEAAQRILAAAKQAGAKDQAECTIGLGVPSRKWSEAAVKAIDALARLGGGSVTLSDADVSLVAAEGTDQSLFDEVVGELENSLPDIFALHPVLPKPPKDGSEGPPEFSATLSPEGLVQLRGRVAGELDRTTMDSFAKARFGSDRVRTTARIDEDLPDNWSVRVLAGLEALDKLAHGSVRVTPDVVEVKGVTGLQAAKSEIAGLFSEKLGDAAEFSIEVTYDKKLDPLLGLPTPEECEAQIAAAMDAEKIVFQPGLAEVDPSSAGVLDAIAEILKKCEDIPFEIGGHTDSQGREIMNQELSQARAQSVLEELRKRRVRTSDFVAVGYGETQPIADNKTEEGREINRRIEFKLIKPEPPAHDESVHGDDETPAADSANLNTAQEGAPDEQN